MHVLINKIKEAVDAARKISAPEDNRNDNRQTTTYQLPTIYPVNRECIRTVAQNHTDLLLKLLLRV
jgi:hypothetical protein